jgi:hypothetical protein
MVTVAARAIEMPGLQAPLRNKAMEGVMHV